MTGVNDNKNQTSTDFVYIANNRSRLAMFYRSKQSLLWCKPKAIRTELSVNFRLELTRCQKLPSLFTEQAISELPLASFSKRVLVHNHSYENEFNLHVNEISISYKRMGTNSEMAYSSVNCDQVFFLRRRAYATKKRTSYHRLTQAGKNLC